MDKSILDTCTFCRMVGTCLAVRSHAAAGRRFRRLHVSYFLLRRLVLLTLGIFDFLAFFVVVESGLSFGENGIFYCAWFHNGLLCCFRRSIIVFVLLRLSRLIDCSIDCSINVLIDWLICVACVYFYHSGNLEDIFIAAWIITAE